MPVVRPLASKIEQTYTTRLLGLPAETRLFVLAAAAEPVGDPVLLRRAAASLGLDIACAATAADAGLLAVGGRVKFANPLVRSAVYQSAAVHDRHRVHRALAEATDREQIRIAERGIWRRPRRARRAGSLRAERSAGRAQARGGLAAAAAFLQRAVVLTNARTAGRPRAGRRAGQPAGRRVRCRARGWSLRTAEVGELSVSAGNGRSVRAQHRLRLGESRE